MLPEPPPLALPADFPAARARILQAARAAGLTLPLVQPELRIFKAGRRLELWAGGRKVKAYRVGLGLAPEGDKVREGDTRTPEGRFYICTRNDRSKFHRFLGLSYPNPEAAARGLKDGLITPAQHRAILDANRSGTRPPWDTPLGGQVGIHGAPSAIERSEEREGAAPSSARSGGSPGHGSSSDWTWGCVALDDGDIEELWEACPVGTSVLIRS